ncbi:protein-glutamine gamma-glutamyltransferase 2-like [Gadus macrocephalus]|uniref:protein-glutamine gamma-glutamyltransferase 2-like n=1 Tax=Gadus macrocephalus TaxID=80720 RepID=UPI0028CB6B6D|nr:protein-glutamine gamma-glutamyltransferase 2-like [Gadus macrocephalus]
MSQVLEIERCDLDIKSNKRSHHTEQNGEDRLIVRRGQPFSLVLHLKAGSPEFNPEETSFTLIVETGTLLGKESDTKVSFGLKDSTDDKEWSASASKAPGNTVALNISSSPEAPIGLYSLSLLQQGQSTSLGAFVLLFNAWCPRDAVYMRSETKRQEYVLSQHGLLYRGSATRIHHKPWNFSQFEPGILDICLKILDEGLNVVSDTDQDCSERRSPVYITRVLSAMINSNDNQGVLVGEWAEFEDGVHPSTWIGSGDILRQWADSGPVCYGQCWVFAAVDCTVSRALGIPCRVVTNFSSAHDGNGNLLIEKMYDEDGERLEDPDSVWNFHVWVESWMARPDLEQAGFDGWQVSDATPQETSEGVFCCGPVPVSAIREGELTKKFDAPFVFAEVNADVVEYVKLSTGDFVTFSGSTDSIGQNISTKAVGSDKRRDITHHYKYPEGSEEERRVFEKAQHRNKLQKKGEEPGLRIKIKLAKNMVVGSDFEVYSVLANNCMVAKSCSFMLYARAVRYNSTRGASCGFISDTVTVTPGEEKLLFLKLKYSDYGKVISPDRMIQVTAFVNDKENGEYHKAEKLIVLDEPDLEVKLTGEARVGQPLTAELYLLNPLPEALQDCSFTLEGVGLTQEKPITIKLGTVASKQEAKASVQLSPREAGFTVLLVDFDSDKLKNIKNFIPMVVMSDALSPSLNTIAMT